MQDSLLAALRGATSHCHQDTEQLFALDGATLPRYQTVVRTFEAFLRAWEPQAAAVLPPSLRDWFLARSRFRMARKDLEAMGLPPADVAVPDGLVPDFPSALGAMYVLEGSTLGGQVIARQAARLHGLGPDTGAAFFHGWGARTGSMWREFQEVLALHEQKGVDRAAVCAGAQRTFGAIGDVFREVANEC